MHTVTFSHRFLLFGSKLELPWDCGTIENDAKTLPCARSLRQCPQYTLNNLLLNFIEHMKKWGGQLDIRPSQSKNWGGRVPPIPPRIDAPAPY